MLTIPFIDYPQFTNEINLDDQTYRFQFLYNVRADYWTVSFFDTDLNPLLTGIKLVLNYELIYRYRDYGGPQGELYVVDTTDSLTRVGKNAFKEGAELVYVTVAELV